MEKTYKPDCWNGQRQNVKKLKKLKEQLKFLKTLIKNRNIQIP